MAIVTRLPRRQARFVDPPFVPEDAPLLPLDAAQQVVVDLIGAGHEAPHDVDP